MRWGWDGRDQKIGMGWDLWDEMDEGGVDGIRRMG